MRKWIAHAPFCAGLVIASIAWSSIDQANAAPPLEGDMEGWLLQDSPTPAPEFAVTLPDGSDVVLDDFSGRLILMNFWATWCAPCLEEMPSLDRLNAAFEGQPFEVVAISVDRGGYRQVEPAFDGMAIETLRPYLDPAGGTPYLFQAVGFPTTVLIAPDGRVIGDYRGPAEWDTPEARAFIDYYLAEFSGS
ncbi:MAG: TlpA disulfide reductase family protein [Pseudomonadota bacterium]